MGMRWPMSHRMPPSQCVAPGISPIGARPEFYPNRPQRPRLLAGLFAAALGRGSRLGIELLDDRTSMLKMFLRRLRGLSDDRLESLGGMTLEGLQFRKRADVRHDLLTHVALVELRSLVPLQFLLCELNALLLCLLKNGKHRVSHPAGLAVRVGLMLLAHRLASNLCSTRGRTLFRTGSLAFRHTLSGLSSLAFRRILSGFSALASRHTLSGSSTLSGLGLLPSRGTLSRARALSAFGTLPGLAARSASFHPLSAGLGLFGLGTERNLLQFLDHFGVFANHALREILDRGIRRFLLGKLADGNLSLIGQEKHLDHLLIHVLTPALLHRSARRCGARLLRTGARLLLRTDTGLLRTGARLLLWTDTWLLRTGARLLAHVRPLGTRRSLRLLRRCRCHQCQHHDHPT